MPVSVLFDINPFTEATDVVSKGASYTGFSFTWMNKTFSRFALKNLKMYISVLILDRFFQRCTKNV